MLINDLRVRRADDQEHVVLVLDDYRVITAESIHHALSLHSLLGCDDVANFITAFSGHHHYVMDYLLDEVLSRQSKAVQDFLVQISLLEQGMDLVKGTRLFDQKNHPEITPFGYWLVSSWSVMLLRGIILTRRFPGLFRRFWMYVPASTSMRTSSNVTAVISSTKDSRPQSLR